MQSEAKLLDSELDEIICRIVGSQCKIHHSCCMLCRNGIFRPCRKWWLWWQLPGCQLYMLLFSNVDVTIPLQQSFLRGFWDALMGSDSFKKKNHHPTISKYHRMLRKHQQSLQVGTVFREEVERGDWYCFGFPYFPWTSFFFFNLFSLLKWIQVINTVDTNRKLHLFSDIYCHLSF